MTLSVPDIAVYDHLRSTAPDADGATYRVVGTGADTVTLLRVSDGNGRRANTGEVVTVPRESLDAFETAENPDGNRSLGATLRSAGSAVYWSLRGAAPLRLAGFALVVGGAVLSGAPVAVPAPAADGLLLLGAVGILASWVR